MAESPRGQRRASSRRGDRVRRRLGATHRRGGVGQSANGRIRLLRVLVIGFLVLIGGRAVALAATSDDISRLARQQQNRVVDLPAHRGAILDRHGRELAVGTPRQTVYAAPNLLDDPSTAARDLCAALHITRKKERRAVTAALSDRESGFCYVARKADPELVKAALALKLPGVGSYAEEKRSHPMKASATQLIGFAGVDNDGLAGIELQYDAQLSGVDGSQVVVRDPAGRLLRTVAQTEPVPGSDVRLTLDADIQLYAERVLMRTLRDSQAKAAVAIVMDPHTGEVLADVNAPTVKNEDFGRKPENDRNRAITDLYEPGSIFKLVTIAGALADGVVKPTTRFTLASSIRVADRVINESHERGVATYSVAEILQWSSNVGAVTIGRKMGSAEMYKWIEAFGFGKATGVEFPGEGVGIVHPLKEWSDSSIGNIPMGQGVAVTPLQMIAAAAVIANNGVAVTPKLVAQVGSAEVSQEDGPRVIPARVAREVRDMLALAVAKGTGTKAQIEGYEVAGKTGTSQKPLPDGSGYSEVDYMASFVGMVPADHPRLVVLVVVDEPRAGYYGGDIAAPAVQQIMRFALQHLEIRP
jgi:cell division protein FtsI (penicillin-binding protein 3)